MVFSIRLIFFVAVTLSSYQKEHITKVAPAVSNRLLGHTAENSNLIFVETFEGDAPFRGLRHQFSAEHSFQVVTSPVFTGDKAGRFDLRATDSMVSNGTRAEVLFAVPEHRERWYSFAVYFPSDKYEIDSNNDIINQWHQEGSPATSFRIKKDKFTLRTGSSKASRQEFDLGIVKKDTWHHFVFHIIHSNNEDGLVEVWHNRSKVFAREGGNMYEGRLPRWKVGIYKDNWNGERVTDTDRRVYYIDDVKVGNQKAVLSEMW